MSEFIVHGGRELSGEIKLQGSKNEALQVICAALMTDETVILHNMPDISDMHCLLRILSLLGAQIKQFERGSYYICAKNISLEPTGSSSFRTECSTIRASIMLMAPLLTRFKKLTMVMPGGDNIGKRKIDAHLRGLEQLGVTFSLSPTLSALTATRDELRGADVLLIEPSVTATANLIMAASLATGKSTIFPAACEPHVQQLCHLLVTMGAKITGIGTNFLSIEGVSSLTGSKHAVLSDMIEMGSFICLATVTRSRLTIIDVPMKLYAPVLDWFERLGVVLERGLDSLHIPKQGDRAVSLDMDNLVTLYDAAWPGFPADLISVAIVVAVHARGSVLIHQRMFESRLFFVDQLVKMGAHLVLCDPHRVYVLGLGDRKRLIGTLLNANDIRAGMSILIAALAAEGVSTLTGIYQVDRGYECIDKRLNVIGACIHRVTKGSIVQETPKVASIELHEH